MRGCATRVPAAMQWPRAGVTSSSRARHLCHSRARRLRFCHPRARCSFLSPSPLGGRGEGEGGCWRHLEPLGAFPLCLRLRLRGASPLSLRLRLRSAQGGALILSPGGGEESGKGDAPPRPCRHAVAARGGDKQEPDAPPPRRCAPENLDSRTVPSFKASSDSASSANIMAASGYVHLAGLCRSPVNAVLGNWRPASAGIAKRRLTAADLSTIANGTPPRLFSRGGRPCQGASAPR